jgi:hypothetical protein
MVDNDLHLNAHIIADIIHQRLSTNNICSEKASEQILGPRAAPPTIPIAQSIGLHDMEPPSPPFSYRTDSNSYRTDDSDDQIVPPTPEATLALPILPKEFGKHITTKNTIFQLFNLAVCEESAPEEAKKTESDLEDEEFLESYRLTTMFPDDSSDSSHERAKIQRKAMSKSMRTQTSSPHGNTQIEIETSSGAKKNEEPKNPNKEKPGALQSPSRDKSPPKDNRPPVEAPKAVMQERGRGSSASSSVRQKSDEAKRLTTRKMLIEIVGIFDSDDLDAITAKILGTYEIRDKEETDEESKTPNESKSGAPRQPEFPPPLQGAESACGQGAPSRRPEGRQA